MGGAPSVPQRNLTQELGKTFGAFKTQELPLFNNQWFNQQPLLSGARSLALGALTGATPWLTNLISTEGALSPEQQRYVDQQTLGAEGQSGMSYSLPGIASRFLNRDIFRQQRLAQGIQQLGQLVSPALATEQAATGTFATLLNPLLNYSSDLFSSNQNAAAAQSIMGANKGSSALGSATSVLGAAATAY